MSLDDFGNSKAIHTVRLPEVRNALQLMNADNYYGSLHDRVSVKRSIYDLGNRLKDWLAPIIDCSSFQYVYYTNGIHAALEQWLLSEHRPIYCFRGEYTYPLHLRPDITIVDTADQIPLNAVVYMSMPFSATGMYDARYNQLANPVILDLAYVGTTPLIPMTITANTEQIFWSGSKSFGIGHFRTGVRFTKIPDLTQEHINSVGYVNWLGLDLLSNCVKLLSVTALYSRFENDYNAICTRNNLIKSASFLIATSTDSKYNWLSRENGTLRIPTGRILDNIWSNQ